ncbi:hypothetical protein B0H10DRAFT_2222745 [Mycena sp. CBHHK59/15]|nr:hypothetical protein B0H10DRAFT_2222745 [Mycena sp. CBHHK59/15]
MATLDRALAGSPVSIFSLTASSTYETTSGSSSSTVPGPGALTGKAIKALGRVTIRGIDHFVILRQLSVIAHHFPLMDEKAAVIKHIEEIYDHTLEFSRQGLYREEINRKALRLLLGQVGLGETQFLVRALSRWDTLELRIFLSEILIQLVPLWNPPLRKVFYSPLLDAYSRAQKWAHISILPFLLFISKLVRTHSSVCRAVLDVGFLDVLILIRTYHGLNKEDIITELDANREYSSHRRRLLVASNAALLDIAAYPEHRPVVLGHPICSTWVSPRQMATEIPPFTSRTKAMFLTPETDVPDDDSLLYLTLDLPTVCKLPPVSELDPEELLNSLPFDVAHDQALRVFLLRSPHAKKVQILSGLIKHMLENGNPSSPLYNLRSRYRLLFFLRLIAAASWNSNNRTALVDAGVVDFLVQIIGTEVPGSYMAILAGHESADRNIPAIIREHGLTHLLSGPLAQTSRLVRLIATAFSALFPEGEGTDA